MGKVLSLIEIHMMISSGVIKPGTIVELPSGSLYVILKIEDFLDLGRKTMVVENLSNSHRFVFPVHLIKRVISKCPKVK